MTELIAELTRLSESVAEAPWEAVWSDEYMCWEIEGVGQFEEASAAAFAETLRNALPQILKALEREERLADALKKCVGVMEKNIYPKPDVGPDHPYSVLREAREALETPHAK